MAMLALAIPLFRVQNLLMNKPANRMLCVFALLSFWLTGFSNFSFALDKEEASAALKKSVNFFRTKVGYNGAYLYLYSADLKKQEGEGLAFKTTGWVQPPGTPYIGEAYLEAHRLTGEDYLLDAAKEVASALRASQLRSGGWGSRFELGKEQRKKYNYRSDPDNPKGRNQSTFDDNKTQSCLTFLMHLDQRLEFKDLQLRDVLDYAFEKCLATQFPNGGWPQRFSGPPNPDDFPIKKAAYPETWSREYPAKKYGTHYTLNDNAISDMINVMLEAHRIYGDEKFMSAAKRSGDFLILAQMPDPQPGWAQQYNANMEPAWARKFEPPSITGGESQSAMQALLLLYRATADKKYLGPIPKALAYYKNSLLPNGKLARFYELKTNKPLYFTKDYQLTYSDSDMPTHYSFVINSGLDKLNRGYEALLKTPDKKLNPHRKLPVHRKSARLEREAQKVINTQDERGAWVEKGVLHFQGSEDRTSQVISTKTFVKKIRTLSQFISAE